MGLQQVASGGGVPVVLLHGLTATRRYVVFGSSALERSGHRVIAYDARGHGESDPAPAADAYGYEHLVADLLAVMDEQSVGRAVLAGVSMGAHTALRAALAAPDRVAGLVLLTPGFDPRAARAGQILARWDALADGLRKGGVEGFLEAYGDGGVAERWRGPTALGLRQRMALHEHPEAVADALHVVPRSQPFESFADLEAIAVPTTVIADRDDADAMHPLTLGRAYAAAIAGANLLVEEPGATPIAWQGSKVSEAIAQVAAQAGLRS